MNAIITGGTRGIGYAIAKKLASNNYNLILTYHNLDSNAMKVREELENLYKVKVIIFKMDVSKEEDVKKLSELSNKEFDNLDLLVNNAGISIDTTVEDKTVENFNKILNTNLIGPFLTCKYIGKTMYENKSGRIINISSTNAIDTYYPEGMDYDASKAGLNSLTHNFATLYSPYVLVNAIASGWVETDMNKDMDINYKKNEEKKILLNRFAKPDEIADVVYFLSQASYINSAIIRVDGGTYKGE